jgi:hypothetical protein
MKITIQGEQLTLFGQNSVPVFCPPPPKAPVKPAKNMAEFLKGGRSAVIPDGGFKEEKPKREKPKPKGYAELRKALEQAKKEIE